MASSSAVAVHVSALPKPKSVNQVIKEAKRTPFDDYSKGLTVIKDKHFQHANEELGFAREFTKITAERKPRTARGLDPIMQRESSFQSKERNHKVHQPSILMTTIKTKPSADEVYQSKNRGTFNLYDRKSPKDWKPCTKRVESYERIIRKDDLNLKRGVMMVDHFTGYADPITVGDVQNLYEKPKVKVGYISAIHPTEDHTKVDFTMKNKGIPKERTKYESSVAQNEREKSAKQAVGAPRQRTVFSARHAGQEFDKLVSYKFALEYRDQGVSRKPNNLDRSTLSADGSLTRPKNGLRSRRCVTCSIGRDETEFLQSEEQSILRRRRAGGNSYLELGSPGPDI